MHARSTCNTEMEVGSEPVNASISTALLLKLFQATPEELAALERFLAGKPLPGARHRLPSATGATGAPSPQVTEPDQEALSVAAKVFELLKALDPDNRLRKAPPIKVFLLRFRQNLSLSQIARACDCGRSLIALRLKTIQQKLPWHPRQLRELSAQVEAMQDAVSDSRARRIYRKGAVYGDEESDDADE